MSIVTVSVRELRTHLADILKKVNRHFDRCIITVRGKPEAVILSTDDYESIIETMEIEADTECMKRIKEAEAQLKRGKGKKLDIIREELKLV